MAMYSDLTDTELAAEIAAFRAARRAIILGTGDGVGAVKRISDGDRTVEYTSANLGALDQEMKDLLWELRRRANGGIPPGNAIQVEFD